MTIAITCPGCRSTLRIKEEYAGQTVKCPRCEAQVAVPAGEVAEVEAIEEVEGAVTERPAPRRSPAEEVSPTRRRPERDDPRRHADDERPRSRWKPCPRCGATDPKRVNFTFWGSFYFTGLFHHVRCLECGCKYNGKSGKSNIIPAIICVTIPAVLIAFILFFMVWVIFLRGYFGGN